MALEHHRPLSRLSSVSVGSWLGYALLTALVATFPRSWPDVWLHNSLLGARIERTPAGVSYRLAHLGASEYLLPLALVVGTVWALWTRRLLPAGTLIGSYFVMSLVVSLTKRGLHRAEPGDVPGAVGRSFPSGHVASAVVVFGGIVLVWWLLGRPARPYADALPWLAGLLIALVTGAMIWRSAHWLSDAVGGILAGVGSLAALSAATLVVESLLPLGWGGVRVSDSRQQVRPH